MKPYKRSFLLDKVGLHFASPFFFERRDLLTTNHGFSKGEHCDLLPWNGKRMWDLGYKRGNILSIWHPRKSSEGGSYVLRIISHFTDVLWKFPVRGDKSSGGVTPWTSEKSTTLPFSSLPVCSKLSIPGWGGGKEWIAEIFQWLNFCFCSNYWRPQPLFPRQHFQNHVA